MSLLIFPGIILYFLIGAAFSKAAETRGDDFTAILWFIFWPLLLLMGFTAAVIAMLMLVIKSLVD